MKILLLAGTGAMGDHLRGKLVSRGFDVVVTSRRERAQESGVRYVQGNAADDLFLKQLLAEERPDAIVDFLSYGTIQFMNRRNVLLNGTAHYLFLSSCRVFHGEEIHTEKSSRLLDVVEDTAYLQTDEYGLAKARQENLLRESGKTNWTIIRPCITYSAPRFQFGCLEASTFVYRAQKGYPVPIPSEMLVKRTTMMWAGDTAEMIARLVLNKSALGEDFNTVTSESHTWREVAEYYHELIGLNWKECSVSEYSKLCNPYQLKYGRMVHHCFDNSKILSVTSMQQEMLTKLDTGLEQEIKRVKTIVPDIQRNALMDRLLGTKTKLDITFKEKVKEYYAVRYPIVGRAINLLRKAKNLI